MLGTSVVIDQRLFWEVTILCYSLVTPCKYLVVGNLPFYFMLDLTDSVSKDAARVLPVTG